MYLTEREIAEALRLPQHLARQTFALWRMNRSFPQPVKLISGRTERWWYPEIVQWLNNLHHVKSEKAESRNVTIGNIGEDFDAWRASRKTRQHKMPGAHLPTKERRLDHTVVTPIGHGCKGVPSNNKASVAPVDGNDTPA